MSTYENLHGKRVNVVSTNPSNPGDGEVWYNSTLGQLKGYVLGVGSWASGGAHPTGVIQGASAGSQTALWYAAGSTAAVPTASGATNATKHYNGTSWTAGGNYPNADYGLRGTGTLTAGLACGSFPKINRTGEYDGSAWTSGGTLNTGRSGSNVFGVQTAGVAGGGDLHPDSPRLSNASEEYDGSAWTSVTNIPAGRRSGYGTGTLTAGLICQGALAPGNTNTVLEYDGTNWTSGGNALFSTFNNGASGSQTAALTFNGSGNLTTTNGYDGTSWSTRPSTATGREAVGSGGNEAPSSLSITIGGSNGPPGTLTNTEEFTQTVETKTLTTS